MAYKKIQDVVSEDVTKRALPTKEDPIEDEPMGLFSLRIPKREKNLLQRYFKKRGLKLSQGIRMVLADFMRDEGLE